MTKPFFTGACTALVTPFLNGKINYPMVEVLIQRQINAGIPAVVLSGTTGESPTLSDAEKLALIRVARKAAGSALKIIAGTGSNSTAHAVDLSIAAENEGADGLLVVSPYYNKATPEGLYAHYVSIASAVKIPIIIYNVPSRTGVDIPVSVYRELSKIPNIVGVKEASPSIAKILEILTECPPHFSVWTGNDDMTVPTISLGGQGVISVLSNVFPAQVQAMASAALDGDFKAAADAQKELYPLTKQLFSEVNPIPVKYAMKCIGYDCGECRLPLTTLSLEYRKKLEKNLK